MQKFAKDIKPGDIYKGQRVESVEIGNCSTMVHWKRFGECLMNNAQVWVEQPTVIPQLRDAFGREGDV